MRRTVLMIGHGSRDASANQEFEELVARFQARRPELDVRHGYIELAQPSLADALAALPPESDDVTLLPVILFAAGHVKNDIPTALAGARRRHPAVRFRAARAIGVHPALVQLATARAREAAPWVAAEAERTAAIVVGRGSSDAEANADFCKLTRLIAEAGRFAWVEPAFISITRPRFEETLELVALTRPERLVVIPYLLFGGELMARLGKQLADFRGRHPSIDAVLAPHLGASERLLDALEERLDEANRE